MTIPCGDARRVGLPLVGTLLALHQIASRAAQAVVRPAGIFPRAAYRRRALTKPATISGINVMTRIRFQSRSCHIARAKLWSITDVRLQVEENKNTQNTKNSKISKNTDNKKILGQYQRLQWRSLQVRMSQLLAG